MSTVSASVDCSCKARLTVAAQPTSPYSWECPREITCRCGQSYVVKLVFVTGKIEPFIEFWPKRTPETPDAWDRIRRPSL